jgi:hypothetical protein
MTVARLSGLHASKVKAPRNAMSYLWKQWAPPRSTFGDWAIILFLIVQGLDGLLTYHGVVAYGPSVEANPFVASMMQGLGWGTGLMTAKIVAGSLGIALHVRRVHGMLALLTGIYLAVAILPWTAILFF